MKVILKNILLEINNQYILFTLLIMSSFITTNLIINLIIFGIKNIDKIITISGISGFVIGSLLYIYISMFNKFNQKDSNEKNY